MNTEDIKAEFTRFTTEDEGWVSAIVSNIEKLYFFEAKLFDEPSKFGIDNGRISKLTMWYMPGEDMVNYDRGWDIEPTDAVLPYYIAVVELLEQSPKRFS